MEFYEDENYALISVNPKTYPLEAVYSAAYVFTDKSYVLIEGDPSEEIIVELRPKDKKISAKKLAFDFNNELLNYSLYGIFSKKNAFVRDSLIRQVFLTNSEQGKKNKND